MADEPKFTHIAIEKGAQRKIAILAPIAGKRIYDLVGGWVDFAWEAAKLAGQVSDAMLTVPSEQVVVAMAEAVPSVES